MCFIDSEFFKECGFFGGVLDDFVEGGAHCGFLSGGLAYGLSAW